MKLRHALLATAVIGTLGLAACKRDAATPSATNGVASPPAGETADEFIARVNAEYRKSFTELTSAQWLSNTYINGDTELLAAKANERWLTQLNGWIEQSKRFDGQQLSPETARAIKLLKLMTAMPAPKDPNKLEELTRIATRMEGMYGSGSYCTGEGQAKTCRDIGQLSEVLAKSRDYDAQLDAWQGWHSIAQPMRGDYTRFVELVNEGARSLEEGIASKASDIDMVYLTGYGFPLHRGGPMCYADTQGLFNVVEDMKRFARNPHDDAAFWQPAPLLARLVAEGKTFNPA